MQKPLLVRAVPFALTACAAVGMVTSLAAVASLLGGHEASGDSHPRVFDFTIATMALLLQAGLLAAAHAFRLGRPSARWLVVAVWPCAVTTWSATLFAAGLISSPDLLKYLLSLVFLTPVLVLLLFGYPPVRGYYAALQSEAVTITGGNVLGQLT